MAEENALVEFIPFDDDGVLTPTDDRTIDTIVKGGLFTSALGHAPSDIVLEGDEFVSPDTSYAPEEAVPGQIFDTVDIKVYTSPESGVPFVSEMNYRGDGSTTTYSIGDYPGTLGSVTVAVDGMVQKGSALDSTVSDYTIDVANKTITFNTAPANASVIKIERQTPNNTMAITFQFLTTNSAICFLSIVPSQSSDAINNRLASDIDC